MNVIGNNAFIAVAAVLAAIAVKGQWQFSLDTTFRTQIIQQNTNSILLLPDGKLIASGIMRFTDEFSDKRLVRLLPDGTRDESFYSSGLGGGKTLPWQPDRFYVQGSFTPRRIWTDTGLNDGSFAVGSGAIPYFLPNSGGDYHVFEDGRVVITGNHHLSDSIRGFTGWYKLIWFSNEGYLDTTRIHRQANGPMWNFTALPDGKFLCSCSCTEYEGQPVGRVFRIHADGSLDTTFQTDVFTGNIRAHHPLPDGRVIIGGDFRVASAPDILYQLVRLMPDGSFDPTFNNDLVFGLADGLNGAPRVSRIVPWQDDKYFVTGTFRNVNGETRGGICVTDTAGQLLSLMDECLNGPFTYMVNTNASIHGITPTPDGTGFYINGTYAGYTDGTINDTLQRFVSRLLVEVDTTVGINATKAPAIFSLHPNPASGMVHITLAGPAPNGLAQVRDALGRLVYVQQITNTHSTLDLQALSDGLYFVSISTHELHLPAQRLVLQR